MKDPTSYDLKHRITIQEAVETQGADGSVVQTWETFKRCRAAMEPLSGNEFFAAQATQANVTGRIWVRYLDGKGVTPKMRVLWGDRVYEISSVINYKERNKFLQLMVDEDVDG
jgi:SPP1 family predicted phage head-tail adaptor